MQISLGTIQMHDGRWTEIHNRVSAFEQANCDITFFSLVDENFRIAP